MIRLGIARYGCVSGKTAGTEVVRDVLRICLQNGLE
jgi:hypothetical protein